MQQKYFLNPFAEAGDKTAVPDTLDPSGYVSYEQGYGFDYERNNDGSDPLAKNIERQKMNELFFDMTSNLQQYQQHGTPEFITSVNNGGTAYSYSIDAKVRYDDSGTGANWRVYRSKANTNTALPTDTTKWELAEYATIAPQYTGIKSSNLASASTVNIGAATGDYIHITGTTTITAFDTIAAGIERTIVFDGALTLTHNATSLILPTGANITTVAGDTAVFRSEGSGNWRLVGGTIYTRIVSASISSAVTGIRQTVQFASVDSNGYPNFITAGTGLSANISATTTNIVIHAAGGKTSNDRLGIITADTTISGLTANATNYLYADVASNGAVTLGFTTLAPVYQFGGTYSTTNGRATFNIAEMTMKVGNGTTASQVYRVFLGEAITGASTVTSVVNYALNGLYDSGFFAVAPFTVYSNNHNLGIPLYYTIKVFYKVQTADATFAVGDIMPLDWANIVGNTSLTAWPITSKTAQIHTYAATFVGQAAGAGTTILKTDGYYLLRVKRDW